MAIRVKCPNPACGKEHNLKAELAGKTVRCSFCQQVFTVPSPPAPLPEGEGRPAQPGAAVPHAPGDPLVGKQIAYYRIESLLGKGGMGKVYKAQNLRLAKTCAIKILPPEAMAEDPTMAERFVREARAAAVIQHPNVLPVHNVAKVEENYFIEMDYVDGGTLHGLMRQKGRLDVKEAARIIRDAAAGLAAAHEKGIIHRDIKPSNVMLTSKGHVYVMDFGLAKVVQSKSGLTQQGYILGTPWYMSPEQAMAQPADQRSDIYSLGVMFYQILTGSPPYTADSPVALLLQHKEAPIPDIKQVLPGCPVFIAAMIRKMMAKDPAERYQSCAEVVAELNAFLVAPPGTMVVTDSLARRPTVLLGANAPRTPRGAARKRSPAPAVLVLVLLLVLVLGGVAYFVVKGMKGSGLGVQVSGTTTETATTVTADGRRLAPMTEPAQGHVAQPPPAMPIAPPPSVGVGHPQAPQGVAGTSAAAVPSTPAATGTGQPQGPPPTTASTASKEAVPPTAPATPASTAPVTARSGAEGAATKQSQAVDLLSYLDDIKPVNEKIDSGDYDTARSRANLFKDKYPDPMTTKLANLDRIVALRKRCIERVNSGAVKLTMGEVSKRYAFAGEVKGADGTGLTAAIKKGWETFNKEEMLNFYRKASDPKSAEDVLGIAAFVLEGSGSDKAWDEALDVLGEAKALNAEIAPQMKYIETLKQAAKEYAEAAEKGKSLETATAETTKTQSTQRTEQKEERGGKAKEESALSTPSAVKSFDDVFVTTAATGEKIPHPLSKKTTKIIYQGKRVDIPEGFAYVPAGKFKMGENESEHEVYLDAYFIGKYEVTNAEWKAFCDFSGFTPPQHWKGGTIPEGKENHPVVYVSWEDAQKYCEWISTETGRKVSLPTEAQWEKAAGWNPKKNHHNVYPWGDDFDPRRANHCWQLGCRCDGDSKIHTPWWEKWSKSEEGKAIIASSGNTASVAKFRGDLSAYGCYDMGGNVAEWVGDWFRTDYYKKSAKRNPTGPTEEEAENVKEGQKELGSCRVWRGGYWYSPRHSLRASYRYRLVPPYRSNYIGFRCARTLTP